MNHDKLEDSVCNFIEVWKKLTKAEESSVVNFNSNDSKAETAAMLVIAAEINKLEDTLDR